jgi:hypothetical protein
MSDTHPLDNLSKGELRRLYLHINEAQDRLDRAREILDENNIIEWDGSYGFEHTFTNGQAHVDDTYSVVARKYNERRADN